MVRTRKIAAAVLTALALVIVVNHLTADGRARVVVLGFNSRQLNDVQDRLLRETVLREFFDRGRAIVPVMEIESLLLGDQRRNIRLLSEKDIREISVEIDAAYAICGTLEPESGPADRCIDAEARFVCHLVLYRRDDDTFVRERIVVNGADTLDRFFSALAKEIVKRASKQM